MSDDQIKILGIKISSLNLDEVLEEVEKYLRKLETRNSKLETDERKPLVIFTPNPEIVIYAQKDQEFKKIVNTAQINIPDGLGLILAAKILGQPLKERISGVDLMEKLVKLAAIKSLTVGLIGGSRGVAVRALECLRQKYPGLLGWAEEGPQLEMRSEKWENGNRDGKLEVGIPPLTSVVNKIQQTKTSFLFVGLGCPKQEYFIDNLKLKIKNLKFPLVLMAVGGSFDYLSGKIKRAPLFIRSIGFEWVWRLLRQPWRWKRQFSLIKFIWLVLKQKLASQGVTLRS